MGFKFHAEHELSKHPEYHSVLHELRDENGNQMLVIHMDAESLRFSKSVLKRMHHEFACLRQCLDAPIFAIEDRPNDPKWARYVRGMGFEFLMRVGCTDGRSRRCFVSKKKKNDNLQHFSAAEFGPVGGSAALPVAGVQSGVREPIQRQ